MKIKILFAREEHGYIPSDFELKIWLRFTSCTYDEFHDYIDKNINRLLQMKLDFDIGHSDKVIYFH